MISRIYQLYRRRQGKKAAKHKKPRLWKDLRNLINAKGIHGTLCLRSMHYIRAGIILGRMEGWERGMAP
jgi:hypothetical protein